MPWIACGGFYPQILPAQDSRNLGNHGKLGRQGISRVGAGLGGRQTLNLSNVCLFVWEEPFESHLFVITLFENFLKVKRIFLSP